MAVLCFYFSRVEFTGENAWLNEPGAWLLIAALGMAFALAGFAGIMDAISERDAKFTWVDLPARRTGKPEPFMRYQRTCPTCKGQGFLEVRIINKRKINAPVFHASCRSCRYDIRFPWMSKGFVLVLFAILMATATAITWQVCIEGGTHVLFSIAHHWLALIMLGAVLYMVSNYLILRNRVVGWYIDRQIIRNVGQLPPGERF